MSASKSRDMTQDEARAFALSLPDTTEQSHMGRPDLRVQNKIFLTLPPDGRTVNLKSSSNNLAALVARDPEAYRDVWGGALGGRDPRTGGGGRAAGTDRRCVAPCRAARPCPSASEYLGCVTMPCVFSLQWCTLALAASAASARVNTTLRGCTLRGTRRAALVLFRRRDEGSWRVRG